MSLINKEGVVFGKVNLASIQCPLHFANNSVTLKLYCISRALLKCMKFILLKKYMSRDM